MNNISGQVIKGYELQELIGAGGFGAVYKAYQPLVKRDVAIKIILPDYANQPDFIRRFEVEAQVVARLEHIHIVPLYDYWREPDGAFLVMRWLRGGSLRTLVKKGPLELAHTGRLLDQIASALATAHRHGVIHRDLKPDNILLDEEGNAYLADFGIAIEMDAPVDPEEAELVIGSPAYISPEQIMTEPATPLSDIYSLGIVLFEMLTGKEPFSYSPTSSVLMKHLHEPLPNLQSIRPDLPERLNDVVTKATSKKPEERYADALLLAADFHRSISTQAQSSTATMIGLPPLEIDEQLYEPENPYKGLRAFQEADADDFFGREALVEQLLGRLGESDSGSRFLAVIGPSGSGKSSAVKAGVIPALRRGALPTSDQWYTLEIVPGTHPFEELEAALLRVAVNPPASLLEVFREDERGLTRAIKRILPGNNDELLLIIDQFEELFTMVNDEAERAHFLKSILAAAADERSRLRIIVTLRADFYDRPLLYPDFGELMRKRTEIVLPLSAEELTRAIASPAERVGLKLEAGLAATIVSEIGEQPGALPLLQYALSELFERRSGRTLTLQAYHESGKVLGALARRADELYEALNEDGRQAARQLFLRLVTPGEGSEDTRRRVQQSEISGSDASQNVIERFGKYRLLTFDRDPATRAPTIEVAHEALIRQWGRLRGWIDESRESVRLQRRLTTAADEWFNANREPSFLLSGSRLEQFESWSKETDLMLSEREAEYLAASIVEREKRQAEEEARQANERLLEQRSRQRLRALVAVMLVATIIALGLTGFAFSQQQIAQQNADIATVAQGAALNEANNAATAAAVAELSAAESRSLALASGAQLALSGDNTDLAIALALEANRGVPSIQTQRTLANAAYAPGTRRIFTGHNDRVLSVAFSPDGATALSASTDHTLILWDVATGETIRHFEGHGDWVRAVNFSADGSMAVSASADHTVILWDVATGEIIHQFEGHTGVVYDAVFNGGATRILSASADRTLILWDAQTGELIRRFEENTGEVLSVAFSASGFTALSGSRDSKVILWNVQSGTPILQFEGHQGRVNSVAFSPDEQFALSGAEDRTLILWSFESGQIASRLTGHTAQIHSVAFSQDGLSAASAGEDNTVILWNLGTGAVRRRFLGHTQVISSVRFRPDGRQILSGSWDGSLRLWDISSGAEINRFGKHTDSVNAVAFSPDGRAALSASTDGTLIQWNLETGEIARRFEGHEAGVNCAVFSPDGQMVLSGAEDAILTLWNADDGTPIRQFEGHSDAVLAVAFSPDGRRAISGSRDNTLILWDIETGEQIHRFIGHTFRVTGVAFSPNGERVVSSAFDNTLILWDTGTGESVRRFEGHTDWVRAVAFSPDGRFILSGSSDNSLILWDAATGERIKGFEGHSAQILSLAFSPDGTRAISGSSDTLVIVWDIESGAELSRLEGHSDAVNAVVFSPDGQQALSGSADSTTRLWQVSATLDELIAWTQANRYVRDLTCVEREQYRVEPLCPAPTPIFTPNPQSV